MPTAYDYASGRGSRRGAGLGSGSGWGPGGILNPRFIIVAVIAIALVVLVGFAVSRCVGGGGAQSAQGSSSAASATAVQSSASAASASAANANGSGAAAESQQDQAQPAAAAQPASSAAASAAATTAAAPVAAQPGDLAYPVAQAAAVAYKHADMAVDPSRTNWNFDKDNGHKTIYLTFDDGPSANTERVLDILDRYNAKATFFVTGQEPDYFPLIKETYRRGHTIGLHSMTHDYATCYSSSEGFWSEFDAIGQVVKDQLGFVPFLIRFPGGSSNTISMDYSAGIMSQLVEEVQARGYQYYDWSLSCGDGAVLSTEETIAAGCEPTDEMNVTYLLHDAASKDTTVEALPSIIEYYQAQGYSFEALDRTSLVSHHGVNN